MVQEISEVPAEAEEVLLLQERIQAAEHPVTEVTVRNTEDQQPFPGMVAQPADQVQ